MVDLGIPPLRVASVRGSTKIHWKVKLQPWIDDAVLQQLIATKAVVVPPLSSCTAVALQMDSGRGGDLELQEEEKETTTALRMYSKVCRTMTRSCIAKRSVRNNCFRTRKR